jgi:hypothetical protein
MDNDEAKRAAALVLRVAYALAMYHNRTNIQPEDFRAAARALARIEREPKSRREVDLNTLIA